MINNQNFHHYLRCLVKMAEDRPLKYDEIPKEFIDFFSLPGLSQCINISIDNIPEIDMDKVEDYFKNKSFTDFDDVSTAIRSNFQTEIEKLYASFYYVTQNVIYDEERLNMKKRDYLSIQNIYDTKKGVCVEFELNFQIEKEELFVVKKTNETIESAKLNKREIDNYSKINHPLFPKFFGLTKENEYLIIEFINGQTLSKIEQFNESEKYFILLQIMISINYLHKNGFVYRDLKPNNVMFDSNLNVILIDFDRMINSSNSSEDKNFTNDFSTKFVAPEVNFGNFSYKSDVYSIGQMFFYLFKTNEMNPLIKIIFKKSTDIDMTKRPDVSDLIFILMKFCGKQIQYLINKNEYQAKFIYDECDFNEKMINDDDNDDSIIENQIQYQSNNINNISDNENQSESSLMTLKNENRSIIQNHFININNENINDPNNIDLMIQFYTMNSKLKQPGANILLHKYLELKNIKEKEKNKSQTTKENQPIIYQNHFININNENKNDSSNIDQMIQYYTIAAKQQQPGAALLLYKYQELKKGKNTQQNNQINSDEKSMNDHDIIENQQKNINKDNIDFQCILDKASKFNDPESQYYLGKIYLGNSIVQQDINKSLHYLTLSANQNYKQAQNILGEIYSTGKYVPHNISKAIHYYSLAADQNYAEAQYNLGCIYEKGKYVKCDIDKAIHYYSLASDQNYINAQFNLGNIYYYGENVPRDIKKAFYYYSLAADKDDEFSQFMLGFIYFKGEIISYDINKAIHYYSLAAIKNHPIAQYFLGYIYSSSNYVLRDINKAIHYYSLAADQNDIDSQYNLAVIYYNGEFIQRDINKAIHYFKIAAENNNSKAQIYLGFIYHEGKYIQRNIDKAIYYYKQAANQNHPNALFNLGCIYQNSDFIQHDINKAIHYYLLASKQNDFHSQFNLGCIYYEGNLVPRDINKAIHYFQLAANQNDSNAQFNLGFIYIENKYIPIDIKKSIHYFTLAAKQNQLDAQFNLGLLYENNKFIPRNIKKSIYYYSLAADQHYSKAQFNLGLLYFNGEYVIKNMNKAIYYFSLAAKQNHPDALFFLAMINFYNHNSINIALNFLYLSAINKNIDATFSLGFLYHQGKFIQRDIFKAIHYYKEASSFYNQYAKNNLGVIYKNGFDEKIQKNIGNAIVYFEEAIHQRNDKVSMYNLAHIYLFEIQNYDKSIDLLINSLKQDFEPSCELLYLALIKKFGFNISKIENVTNRIGEKYIKKISLMMNEYKMFDKNSLEKMYNDLKRVDYIYDHFNLVFQSESLSKKIQIESESLKNITNSFYEGFGINL